MEFTRIRSARRGKSGAVSVTWTVADPEFRIRAAKRNRRAANPNRREAARDTQVRRRAHMGCDGDMMEYVRVQLKVCEGCGGLWYRASGVSGVYGRCCAGKLAVHAKVAPKQRATVRGRRHGLKLVQGGAR